MKHAAALAAALSLLVAGCDDPSNQKVAKGTADCMNAAVDRHDANFPCGNNVEIVANDYAFQVPPEVHAGRATFRFVNHGKVRHELNISRLKKGVSMDEFLDSVRADKSVQQLTEGPVGVLFAGPGKQSAAGLSLLLTTGERYAVICIFRDNKDSKRHYDLGMSSVIDVAKARPIAGLPQPATDTVIATDYAFQYPRTVAPGKHTFILHNQGQQRHEFDIALLKKGVTLKQVQDLEKTGANVDSLYEDIDFGLLHARTGVTPFGEMTLDMLPGREYVIACFFKNDDKSPEHYSLGMFGSIKVSPQPIT